MIRIGQPLSQYSLTGVVANDLDKAFRTYDQTARRGALEDLLLLAQGLHIRLPDRDCGVRSLEPGSSATVMRSCYGVSIGLGVRASRLAQEPRRSAQPAVPDAFRPEARARHGARRARSGRPVSRSVRRSSSIRRASCRFVYVTDLSVGRSPEEVLRVLDALQTDELCPCNWQQGEDTLQAARAGPPADRRQ